MPRPDITAFATRESRAKGGRARAAKLQRRREREQRIADEILREKVIHDLVAAIVDRSLKYVPPDRRTDFLHDLKT